MVAEQMAAATRATCCVGASHGTSHSVTSLAAASTASAATRLRTTFLRTTFLRRRLLRPLSAFGLCGPISLRSRLRGLGDDRRGLIRPLGAGSSKRRRCYETERSGQSNRQKLHRSLLLKGTGGISSITTGRPNGRKRLDIVSGNQPSCLDQL